AFGPRTLSTGLSLDPLAYYGHFSTAEAVFGIEFWRFLTFQFLHASPMHIAFNMLGIWFLGRMVEDQLGPKKYLAFYLVCGIFGGVMYLLLNFLGGVIGINFPLLLPNDPATPLIGASAGVYGVVMACAYIAPNATIQLLFPPIPMKMKTFAYGFVALAFVLLLFGTRNAGGQAAHLGGAIAGFFFIRNTHLLIDFFDVLGDSRKPKQPKGSRRLRGGGGGVSKDEVDAVLAKVQATGLGSLSDREREILRDATERQRRG
ncbi:MAG: rhomboid family intramembrane serine protease, partial [Phycisphaerales bacterium]|nr:rhomboid family intramembrane serine protease [Phycisphaerales bacterium]